MLKRIVVILLGLTLVFAQTSDERTFILVSGDRITGQVISVDENGIYTVKTSFGLVTFHKDDIKPDEVELYLKNGDKLKGTLIEESDKVFKVNTGFGEVTLEKSEVEKVDFTNKTEKTVKSQKDDSRWYYGEEQLIDIWFDPVGFPLYENELYFSGFSWAYGLTDKFQLSSKWYNYFYGDLNLRPKLLVFKSGDIESVSAASIGFHFHTRSLPGKYQYVSTPDPLDATTVNYQWVRVGATKNEDGTYSDRLSEGDKPWVEFFGAYTLSKLRPSGQGRVNYNVGISLTEYPQEALMPRVWFAIDADARRNLKLMFELYYDPYFVPWINWMEDEDVKNPVFLDFGFVFTANSKLRIGIHFQKPFLAVYYKF
ncbi:MAG: hypothetical protein GXO91_04040 [FCB group bacterium]|nr:hypothetical protein [FCB group bacterium]